MWIIPRCITYPSVLDMGASTLGCDQFSQLAERSLLWRSKPSRSQTWSKRWKRASWIRVLSTRMLDRSTHGHFVERWTSSLGAYRANRFPMQARDWLTPTPVTSGPPSSESSESADPQLSFWRMSRESSAQRSEESQKPQFSSMSWSDWRGWVTERRQAYSARKKLAHLTDASESSSWVWQAEQCGRWLNDPRFPATWDGAPELSGASKNAKNAHPKTSGIALAWPTPTVSQQKRGKNAQGGAGLPEAMSNWPTPTARDYKSGQASERTHARNARPLSEAVVKHETTNWPTPTAGDADKISSKPRPGMRHQNYLNNCPMLRDGPHGQANPSGPKNRPALLNPDWVETLMGLPIGWTDLGSWATE